MMAPSAAAAGLLLLIASPSSDDLGLTDAEALSAAAGGILGAAAECREISEDRLSAATDRVAALVSVVLGDPDELTSAHALFIENANKGKRAVVTGQTDCGTVERSLVVLERLGTKDSD